MKAGDEVVCGKEGCLPARLTACVLVRGDAGRRVEKAHVVVLDVDLFLNALKEGIDLYQCGIAESLVACKAVAEPELACPEACGPLCVATPGVKAILAVAVLEICRVVIKAGCVNCNGLLNRIRNECLTQGCKLCLYIHLILHKEEVCGFSHRRPDQVIIVLRDRIGR